MEEISDTTHDECGQRANGVLSVASLDKFDSVFFGLQLCLELQSRFLGDCRGKIRRLQEAITAANLAKNHYTRLRTEAEFNKFYESGLLFRG